MLGLLLLIIAIIVAIRYNKWQLKTKDHSLKNFYRHEVTEIKAFFKD